MLLNILKNSVTSRTKFSTLTLLIGLSSALGGCSVVMSPDNETVVGAMAEYAPFDMDDDNSLFSNSRPKKPVQMQAAFTQNQNTQQSPQQIEVIPARDTQTENAALSTVTVAQGVTPAFGNTASAVITPTATTMATLQPASKTASQEVPAHSLTQNDKTLPIATAVNAVENAAIPSPQTVSAIPSTR